MTVMVLFAFIVKQGSSGTMGSIAVERHVLFKDRLQADLHILLRLVTIEGGFNFA